MIYFDSDYMTGAHPEVLRRLVETNGEHTTGYGSDPYTAEARRLILDACGLDRDGGEVYLLEGGTQTNAVVIDRLLDHNDGVVAVDTAHINVHEAGAIESNGHKILTLPGHDGKLDATELRSYVEAFYADETHAFMVRPAVVYISYPTELGTLYSRAELQALAAVCRDFDMPLYIDGARLAYGLAAGELDLKEIAALSDVFYIGGTKCGALFGEAVVTRRPELLPRFASVMKLHGATLAKGRLLGVQFATLFADGGALYSRIGSHGVAMAMRLKAGMCARGCRLLIDSPTNQQFFVLPNELVDRLSLTASFELWGQRGEHESAVRFVTDMATTEADVDALLAAV